jgi:hypothetical protein
MEVTAMSVATIEERIRAHLERHPHATATEIAAALELSRQRVHRAAKDYGIVLAKAAKLAERVRYVCPECGVEMSGRPGVTLLCGQRHDKGGLVQMQEAAAAPKKTARRAK